MTNILIIGYKGFIGNNLRNQLRENSNFNVFTTTYRLIQLKEIKDLILKNGIKVVIHAVSDMVPSSDIVDFSSSLKNVIYPTYKLIDFTSENNIKFVFFSSGGAVYGNHQLELINEDSEKNPINYYGYSKTMIEDYILFKNRIDKLSYLILRPSNVYGIGQSPNKNQGFIAIAIRKILNNEEIQIWGDGSNTKNYIYIDDLTHIVVRLIENNVENKVFNLSSDRNVSLNDIVLIIYNITGFKKNVSYIDAKKFDVANFNISNELLQRYVEFNFTEFETGVQNQIDEFVNNSK